MTEATLSKPSKSSSAAAAASTSASLSPASSSAGGSTSGSSSPSTSATSKTDISGGHSDGSQQHVVQDFDDAVLIVGTGLAGLTAAYELTRAGKRVVFVDQETRANIGAQAFWSLGGIFLVDSKEQRRFGIKDGYELARRDWMNSAQFDRIEADQEGGQDKWAVRWAEEYLKFASGPMRDYLGKLGWSAATVGWAERGSGNASGHGNSVPRFHLTWGTGPEIVRIFADPVQRAEDAGLVTHHFRHQVDQLLTSSDGTRCVGVRGTRLAPADDIERGAKTNRDAIGTFEFRARAVLIATGGIGGSPDLVRSMWPEKVMGPCPKDFVLGVPHHVDGRMLDIARKAGANTVNADRFWFYTEGLKNWNPIWPNHGIRVIPGPSSLWLDATGKRFPAPLFPGSDTLATFKHILSTGYDYSWFILNKSIAQKELALSGSEQNPDVTGKSYYQLLQRILYGPGPVKKFIEHGEDFVVRDNLRDLVDGMNQLTDRDARGPKTPIRFEDVERQIGDRDDQVTNGYSKDAQIMLINNARSYLPEKLSRVLKPHRLTDPKYGPMIAIRMNLITRKTLGGVQTNLESQVLRQDGETPIEGLYAAGELAGFGGGGLHGKNALEGTFLSGCIYSGRAAGIALAR